MKIGKKKLRNGKRATVTTLSNPDSYYTVKGVVTEEDGSTFEATWNVDGKYNINMVEHENDIVEEIYEGQQVQKVKSVDRQMYDFMLQSPEEWRRVLGKIIPPTPREGYDKMLRGNEF